MGLASSCFCGVTGLQRETVFSLLGACVWFHVFVKSLKALAVFSAVNVALSFWIEAVIFGDAMYPLKQLPLENSTFVLDMPDLSDSPMHTKLAYSFMILMSGFFCHALIPTMYNSMEEPRKCSSFVSRTQLAVLGALYLPTCIITYAVYGENLQAPVFFNMRSDIVRNLAILLYCIHLLLSYTVTLFPLQQAFENCLLRMPCHAVPGMKTLMNGDDIPQLEFLIKLVCRTVLVLVTVFLGYLLGPSTLDIFSYMMVPVTFVSLILPCVFYLKLCNEEAGCLDKLANVTVMAIATWCLVWTLTVFV